MKRKVASDAGSVGSNTNDPAALGITRRALLAGTALALGGYGELPAASAAPPPDGAARFLAVSRSVTGKSDLSPVTAQRIHDALVADDETTSARIERLAQIATARSDPQSLKAAAAAAGLDDVVMAITSAWYTGTVKTKTGPVTVAYRDALMYRPVADGLTVPTYCNRGPLWWTGLPPGATRMPVNDPEVL